MDYDSLPMILAPKDVQNILGWRKDQVYRLFKSKKFPSEKIGGKYIIPKPRFLAWLGESEKAS
jgi:predicted DNA-binding transcriptional regulator AlpA